MFIILITTNYLTKSVKYVTKLSNAHVTLYSEGCNPLSGELELDPANSSVCVSSPNYDGVSAFFTEGDSCTWKIQVSE